MRTIPPRKRKSAATRTDRSADGSGVLRVRWEQPALMLEHEGHWVSWDHVDVCDDCVEKWGTLLDRLWRGGA